MRIRSRSTRLLPGRAVLLLALAVAASACAPSAPKLAPRGGEEEGIASWYGPTFHGRPTASGERYDMHALTAAHPTLPFDTLVEVRNLDNGRTTRVRINDRGPFKKRRVIDLSYAAAQSLDMVGPGTARVAIAVLGRALPDLPRYTIQLGAFQERGRADALASRLCDRFPAVEVSSDGLWHRVQLGRFSHRELADELLRELEREGVAALVVALP